MQLVGLTKEDAEEGYDGNEYSAGVMPKGES